MIRRLLLLTVVALWYAATPLAQTVSLSGRVVDAANNQLPVRRAIVTITGAQMPVGRSVITDEQGQFSFVGLPAGEYTLSATRKGFLTATYGATRPGRPGTAMTLTAGAAPASITLRMARGAALGGVLRDYAGDVAPGMRIQAIRIVHTATGDRGEVGGVTLTDDRGEFRIYGLPPGDYVLAATPTIIVMGIGEIGAPSDAEIDAIFASLPRRALGPAPPAPAPGTKPPAEPRVTKGYSTPATFYPGVLSSSEAVRITIAVGEEREGLDFATKLSHAAAIDGTIVPARGQALPQVALTIQGAGPDLPVEGGSAGGPSLSRGADGTFHFSNVRPGHYRIMVRTLNAPGAPTTIASGGALPRIDATGAVQWAMADVDVQDDDITGITLHLQPALRVTGRLAFDARTQRPPDNASVRLSLEPVADSGTGSNGVTAPVAGTAKRDGTFEFPAVLPGDYRLTTTLGGNWALRSALLATRDVLDGWLSVGANDVNGLVVTFSDRRTSVSGTLTTPSGRPATEYFVIAFSTDRAMWRTPSRRLLSTRPTTTGTFEIADLPAGSYFLAVLNDLEPADLQNPAFLESVVPAAVTLTVAEGERKVQDLRIGGGT